MKLPAAANGGRSNGPATDGGLTAVTDDLEQQGRDQIRTLIGTRFKHHGLERLVTALLIAQGYRTKIAPIGADGGVDVVAGRGPMGFDSPRLCVQVKSATVPVDVKTIRELKGVLNTFGAEHGLLVSWGGFTSKALAEARKLFFGIRLWDSDDRIDNVLEAYEDFPADIRAELPLKRIWVVLAEE